MINKLILVGYAGGDPEISQPNGKPMATFSLATSERWRDKATGERRERTQWHRVVVFNEGLCKIIQQYVRKGSKLYLEGMLLSREWTDKDGVKRTTFECVLKDFAGALTLLDSAGGDRPGKPEGEASYGGSAPAARPAAKPAAGRGDMDDEIPF